VISKSVKLAREIGACIAVERETDTVKLADGRLFIKKTLDRNNIFRAQTPQVFKREIIKKAYSIKGGAMTTDDASLVERLGVPIKMLIGEPCNLKITTKDDIKLADALLKKTIRSDY
jgi:2-C-methyl-D-erythritol 4-phosphate cytidylyltransferase